MRHGIEQVFLLPFTGADVNGWTVADWERRGIVGWDRALKSFFLQLDLDPADTGRPAWWLGRQPGALASPHDVQVVLRGLFNLEGRGAFPFLPGALAILKDARARDLDKGELQLALARDALFEQANNESRLAPAWIMRAADQGLKRPIGSMVKTA